MLMMYDCLQVILEVVLLIFCTDFLHQYDSTYDICSLLGK